MLFKVLGAVLLCASATVASAQTLPAEPVSLGDGRVVVSGDASVSVAPEDTGFFNYGDYEHSMLREFRLGLSVAVRATDRISILGQIRSENMDTPEPYALYARLRPFVHHRFDVQIGRIPPTFGRFPRLAYGRDNILIGYPLAYQYLTSLRADALPASVDELLRMRGRGWLANYSVGNLAADRGVPLVNALNWDTGVEASTGWKWLDVSAAVTNGTVSRPLVSDDNAGKQFAGRAMVHFSPALSVGASYARGAFVSRRVLAALELPSDRSFVQEAAGLDVGYEAGHLSIQAEAIGSSWDVPMRATGTIVALQSGSISVQGRYAISPGIYAAVRAEHLTFNRVTGSSGPVSWDAPVSRVEVGGGYYLQRNLIARMSVQFNDRDGGRVSSARLVAAQLLFWF
ncbi:MAG TPA: hypothetical protein VL173_17670 [Vicinamibacterales bacterium]|jgi:hypothetical protein|nr:hypothetical protein [Vicinamibacterales bacterium]